MMRNRTLQFFIIYATIFVCIRHFEMHEKNLIEKAIQLRTESKFGLQKISDILEISKSTVSIWLRDYPLSKDDVKKNSTHRISTKKPRMKESRLWALSKDRNLSKSQIGNISEAAVLFRLSLIGAETFNSVFEGSKSDLVVSVKNKLLRIQVKSTATPKVGLPLISLRCQNKTCYENGEVDFFIGYDRYSDTCFVWSWEEVKHLKAITISDDASERWDKLEV